jgi:hypothetical protein
MTRIRRKHGAVELRLTADEAYVLRALAAQVAELLAPDDAQPVADDPLEALVATSTEPVEAPDDPALHRLLPDAYGDAAAAGEFRRLMESDLRRQKVTALEELQRALADPTSAGAEIALGPDDTETWLQALNDIRLVLGSRLEVTEEFYEQIEALDPDDPRLPQLLAYDWLGYLQESLLGAMD